MAASWQKERLATIDLSVSSKMLCASAMANAGFTVMQVHNLWWGATPQAQLHAVVPGHRVQEAVVGYANQTIHTGVRSSDGPV